MAKAAFVAKAPEIKIEKDVVCITARSGGHKMCWHMSVPEFRKAVEGANKALDAIDGRKVVQLRGH